MLNEFLLVSGWAFWVVLGVLALIEISLLAIGDEGAESHGFATAIAVGALAGCILFTDAFAGARIGWLIIASGAYLALGVVWSVKKWYSFVVSARNSLRRVWDRSSDPKTPWPEYSNKQRPTAAENKQRIVSWMVLWPFSVTWWVLTWPRRAFVWLYERLSTIFDRITERVFAA